MREFKFYKDPEHRWYVDLPEWEGEKDNLEMVLGADSFLEILAQGEGEVRVILSTIAFDGASELTLTADGGIIGGKWYKLEECAGIVYSFNLWLCNVTEFVFGKFPETIWFSKVE